MAGSADKVLNTSEIAEFLAVSPETIARWCSEGRLPGFKIGGQWRVRQSDLNKIIKLKVEKNISGKTPGSTLF